MDISGADMDEIRMIVKEELEKTVESMNESSVVIELLQWFNREEERRHQEMMELLAKFERGVAGY